jgi:hypothetical protein
MKYNRRGAARYVFAGLRLWSAILAGILFLVLPVAAVAQGCASCYTTTAAGGSQTIHALRSGILVLLVPPVLLFLSIVLLLSRWRRAMPDSLNPLTGIKRPE